MTTFKDTLHKLQPGPHPVDKPTYEKDIVGEIKRWDARDMTFSRTDLWYGLGEDSQEFKEYYERHPELLESDRRIHAHPPLGYTGGSDNAMCDAGFGVCMTYAPDDMVTGEPAEVKVEMSPERAAEKVKAYAKFAGADLVGIGPLRQEWVYSVTGRIKNGERGRPVTLTHPTAIAMGFKMDYDMIQHAPDFPTMVATGKGYADGTWVALQVALYIRLLGYEARVHHVDNYQVLVVPVAQDCGLGELSRAGFLMTKEFGLGLRLAVVTTDLPLAHDKPVDIGVQSFCETCKICAEECPSGAIPIGEKTELNGTKRWVLDADACYSYWRAVGTDCNVCMTSCPWTQKPTLFHRAMGNFATIPGPHQSLMVAADKLFYGQYKSKVRPDWIDDDPRWHHILRGRRKNNKRE